MKERVTGTSMQEYNGENWKNLLYPPVLWIRVILVRIRIITTDFRIWIRIRILLFSSGTLKMPTKFFCLLLFEELLHKSLKIKKVIKMSQNVSYGIVQLMDRYKMDPNPVGPKISGSCGSGSTKLLSTLFLYQNVLHNLTNLLLIIF